MGCSPCFTYEFHIVSVVTFLESIAQSLYCRLGEKYAGHSPCVSISYRLVGTPLHSG